MAGAAKARQGPRIKKEGKADVYRIGGVDLPWDPELDLDKPKPRPLYPVIHSPLQFTIPPPPPCRIVMTADSFSALQSPQAETLDRKREVTSRILAPTTRKHQKWTSAHRTRRQGASGQVGEIRQGGL